MNEELDLEAWRLLVSTALTMHARRRLGGQGIPGDGTCEHLLHLARDLGEGIEWVTKLHHVHFEPAYPGLTVGPQVVLGGRRLLLACSVFAEGANPIGVAFTSLITGRRPQVSVAPPAVSIPDTWVLPAWHERRASGN